MEENRDTTRPSPVSPLEPQYARYGGVSHPNSPHPSAGLLGWSNRIEEPHTHGCATTGDILIPPWSWVTIFICFLAFYSFCFSGVFLGIALAKPRWGRSIGEHGNLSYSTATLLSVLFSKTVELSFLAVLVATIGQILSRRAIARRGTNGISIADLTMRQWILQPGLIFTNSDAVKYAAPTLLGALVLVATIGATFYTTAAEALASPKLKFGPWQNLQMVGVVETAFANATFLTGACDTPITIDPEAGGTSCLQIDYAGQAYHNFQSYLSNWTQALNNDDDRSLLAGRPKPVATLNDNTTVLGQWILGGEDRMRSADRLINNVTMAMPHANIYNAAQHPSNKIAQPGELAGQGEYFVLGSLPVPALNVLCVGLSTEEVEPFMYNGTAPFAAGESLVDEIFDFGATDDGKQPAPLFGHLPIVFNTVMNTSNVYGPPSVFLIATPPPEAETDHVICQIKMSQFPGCTTKFHATESGSELSVHCEDDVGNTMPYESDIVGSYDSNWRYIGSEWLKANALSHGISDGNASIARIITQMTPRFEAGRTSLSQDLPSISEALAVLAGSTSVMSSLHAPFNQTDRGPGPATEETFSASVKYKDYASGGSQDWQAVFYVVLVVVFLINLFCLGYLAKHLFTDGLMTDYSEAQNLFALALMSPPSQSLSGACGAGPEGETYGKRWRLDMEKTMDSSHPHFYMRCTDDEPSRASDEEVKKLNRRSRVRSMMEFSEGAESPALEQYQRLAR